tara:strand:+ start:719 stop:1414 length:696 start_codon:yes stop_codon:yes gene_type:complete
MFELHNIKTDWKEIITKILNSEKLGTIEEKLSEEYKNFEGLSEIYPKKELIFNAFNYFNFKDLKVVIIGQDPYHQPNQANGLCFSVNKDIKIPPSLKNIFKEIYSNYNLELPNLTNGNLEYLANQGVLLLNNTLTVRQSTPNSHLKIWKGFSDEIINYILENNDNIVFLLWGNNAKKILKNKELKNNYILEAHHPSPLSANKGGWFGNNHFTKTNEILDKNNKEKITWIQE